MKKNLVLFGILIALLGVTYFFQEKKSEQKFEENLTKDKLYTGPVTKLTISGRSAENVNGQWMSGDELLSHNTFNLVVEKIHHLKKLKSVTGEKKDFFSQPVEFSVNGDQLVLGDLSFDRQGFYLSRNGEMMLAVLEGGSKDVVAEGDDLEAKKFEVFRQLLTKNPAEFKENQLFRYYPDLPFDQITVKVPDVLPFELDFVNNTTTPPPFPGISVHEKLREKFLSLLTQVTLKEEIPDGKFGIKMGEITFTGKGKAVMWELYTRNKKTADAVITDPVRKKAWLMIGGTLKVFFIQLQDYWDKKNIPPQFFKSFDREPITFTEGSLRTIVNIVNREPLEFESTGFKVNKEKMLELVSYTLNLGPLDQASRVSLLSNSEKKQILNETHLRAEIFGQELLYWVKKEELIIVNLSQGYKCHFPRQSDSGGFHFRDVLE